MSSVLEIKNLSKSFGAKLILNDISLEISSGEIYGFLGPNGSGKTTTIKLILGLLEITHGEIRICGLDVKSNFENAIEQVGGIIENPEMYSYLTARENLEQYARMYQKEINTERIDEVLSFVGLAAHADEKISRFSLGMKQRLGVAQAILHKPKLLVLDEPTNGLDPAGIKDLRDLLKRLCKEEGLAVFVSSHLLSELELLCDRVGIINHGKIVGDRSLEELRRETEAGLSSVEIVAENAENAKAVLERGGYSAELCGEKLSVKITRDEIPEAISELVRAGERIFGVSFVQRSLEDAFLEMTTDLRSDYNKKKEVKYD